MMMLTQLVNNLILISQVKVNKMNCEQITKAINQVSGNTHER